MCVALPGEVIEINGTKAIVDFKGNKVEAEAGLVNIKIGDYVLVHAGLIMQVLSKFDNDMLMDIINEMEEI